MEPVLTNVADKIGWITLNRPQKINALSTDLVTTLLHAVEKMESDDNVSVIVIAGAGDNFSVGYDIAEEFGLELSGSDEWHAHLSKDVNLTMAVWGCKKPTIAAVDGWCLAGACELAMACDMIVASERAQFGEPEIRFGSGPVTLLMPFLLGQKKVMELLLTGDVITAPKALEFGMINKIVASDELVQTTEKLAQKIALTPLVTLRLTKLALTRAYEMMGLRNAVSSNLDIAAMLNAAEAPEKTEFEELVKTQGLRKALNWRDEKYGALTDE